MSKQNTKFEIVTIDNTILTVDLSQLIEYNIHNKFSRITPGMNIGRLYIMEFEEGKIKVGKTSNIINRCIQMQSISGNTYKKVYITNIIKNLSRKEKELLDLCNRKIINNSLTEYVENPVNEVILYLQNIVYNSEQINTADELIAFINKYKESRPIIILPDLENNEIENNSYEYLCDDIIKDKNKLINYIMLRSEYSMVFNICFNMSIDDFYLMHKLSPNVDFRTIILLDFGINNEQVLLYKQLQKFDPALIQAGLDYETRKEKLEIRYAQLVAKLLK